MSSKITNPGVGFLIGQLRSYAERLAPGERVTEDGLVEEQTGLYTLIKQILDIDDGALFSQAFRETVALFREFNDGALSPAYLERGWYNLKLSATKRHQFAAVLNLLMTLGLDTEHRNRIVRTNIDLGKVFDLIEDQQKRERAKLLVEALTRG